MTAAEARSIRIVEGTALPLRGHDIDTDRIIPGRFLKAVRFDGLEAHVFEDDRRMRPGDALPHPFDAPQYRGASVLLVERNFGCGSSREHAPQALQRWGIRAIVGQSFSEIFFGNALAIGLPCVGVSETAIRGWLDAVERLPSTTVRVDLERATVRCADVEIPAGIPGPARDAFLSGAWDATALLLDDYGQVETTAARLPYLSGFEADPRDRS